MNSATKITIGIVCLEKKLQHKPMQLLLQQLNQYAEFEYVFFGNQMLLHTPVQQWPTVQVLFCFHSSGFPIKRAYQYIRFQEKKCSAEKKQMCIQLFDIATQRFTLLNREKVYKKCQELQVRVPNYLVIKRDNHILPCDKSIQSLSINDHALSINSLPVMEKPFVEKPLDANNHKVHIYFSPFVVRCLFRKINNKSSELVDGVQSVRCNDSYLYEQYEPSKEDIKVYCVAGKYFYAESRKSPVVDGQVERTEDGFEKRCQIELTDEEKFFAKQICSGFKQICCGMDMIRRTNQQTGKIETIVIDVNGFSFVKKNAEFYTHCAALMREFILDSTSTNK